MSEIFVSYSREDRARVESLVRSLEEQGFSIWWDRDIAPGDSFDELIDTEISQAKVVLVVWTKQSIGSRWVRNEALEGMDRGILVPVLLDDVRIPVAFRQTQLARLLHWPSQIDQPEYRGLVDAIRSKIGRGAIDAHYVKPHRRLLPTRKNLVSAIAIALVLALAVPITLFWEQPTSSADDRKSVAVTRFQTSTGDAGQLLADGISQELPRLLRIGGMPVIHPEAMRSIPDSLAPPSILDRVGARFLVDGMLEERGDAFLLTTTVFDAYENDEIWRHEVSWAASNMLALNHQLARDVIEALDERTDTLVRGGAIAPVVDREAYMLFLQGLRLLRQLGGIETIQAAKSLLERSVDIDSAFAEAHAALCRTHIQLYRTVGDTADFESAEKYCHRALTLEDEDGTIHLALGELYEESGQTRKATNEYDQALLLDAELADAYIGLGNVLAAANETNRAEQAFHQAVSRQPGYWQGFNELGSFYLRQGRLIEAIEAYTRVTYLMPNNPWAFNNRGGARFFSGDFEGAILDWERANTLEPGPASLSNIGTAYFHLRRFEDAAEKYRHALDINPSDHRLWGNLGDTYRLITGKNKEANTAYQRQIALADDNLKVNRFDAPTLSRSAVSLAFMGETDQANVKIGRAIELGPQDIDVLYDAAVTYVTLGDMSRAVDALQRVIDVGYSANLVKSDPLFDGLRDTPEYADFAGHR
jgi:tetratricopeptide (TPR) repeat protein